MSYTKTNWGNNVTPALNATNLNKIEQGIYDAHEGLDDALKLDNNGNLEIDSPDGYDAWSFVGIDGKTNPNTIGYSGLTLGNNIPYGTKGNRFGELILYAQNDKCASILTHGTPSDNRDYVLPDASGEIMVDRTSLQYSTSEKVIGTWINGKPLYRKTKEVAISLNGGQTYEESLSDFASNIKRVIDLKGTFLGNGGRNLILPSIFIDSTNSLTQLSNGLYISDDDKIILRVGSRDALYGSFAYTLQYTKTTD